MTFERDPNYKFEDGYELEGGAKDETVDDSNVNDLELDERFGLVGHN
jgi:hypothetical protein